ncbi:MAG: nucleotidyl transferase AbiEii/AbiGii toxin family protein [Gemmatimonadaceae bacterium]
MNRFLALPPADRIQAFAQAGAALGLSATSVAKDFWVCFTLRELFADLKFGPHLTFKGGTSLSKAWGLIDRLSEDIDLTVDHQAIGIIADREPAFASSQKERQRRITAIKDACREAVHQHIATALTDRFANVLGKRGWSLSADQDDPDGQTLLFAYPDTTDSDIAGYLKPVVKLEFGARGEPWPAELRSIRSLVADQFPSLFDVPEIQVRALRPERTFWEKVMLLHEERLRPGDRRVRHAMARHYYDVWRLIESGNAAAAVADVDLFNQVVAHRQLYFRHTWMDYETIERGSIQMLPAPSHLDDWRRDYQAMQGEMFVTTAPPFDEILAVVERFQADFNTI